MKETETTLYERCVDKAIAIYCREGGVRGASATWILDEAKKLYETIVAFEKSDCPQA